MYNPFQQIRKGVRSDLLIKLVEIGSNYTWPFVTKDTKRKNVGGPHRDTFLFVEPALYSIVPEFKNAPKCNIECHIKYVY